MTWAQRLKRVFNIDIETCQACGSAMKVIACIEDPDVMLIEYRIRTKGTLKSVMSQKQKQQQLTLHREVVNLRKMKR